MLGIFTLAAIIGLALLTYFWPDATRTETFHISRTSLTVAMFAYAGSTVFVKLSVANGDADILTGSAICEVVAWLALANAVRGMFVMLSRRAETIPARSSWSAPD